MSMLPTLWAASLFADGAAPRSISARAPAVPGAETVDPFRDPLFYLMFATIFAVAFAATYLALA